MVIQTIKEKSLQIVAILSDVAGADDVLCCYC